jgi:hypothetical protein
MKTKWVIITAIFLLSTTGFFILPRSQKNLPETNLDDERKNRAEFSEIEGIVIDKNNRPMARMKVSVEPKYSPSREFREAITDRQGKFVITGVRIGTTYLVHAGKDEEGYPCMLGTFHMNENNVQEVTLSKGIKGFVKIALGEKLGVVSGTVKDVAGKPLSIATLRLTVVGNPSRFFGTSIEDDASFAVTVPSEPVVLEVSAKGYETFRSENLKVSSGVVKRLQIRLRHSH